jgi:hypothetical protein
LPVTQINRDCSFCAVGGFKKQLMKSLSEDNLLVSCIDQIFFTLSQNLLLPFKPSLLLELLCDKIILLAYFYSNCLNAVKITTEKII